MESLSFSSLCPTINWKFHLINENNSKYPQILIVEFIGSYRDGSAGNPDAKLMKGIIDTAINLWMPQTILLDLSNFEYHWGDYISYIFESDKKPLITVVGPKCREALSTLINGIDTKKDIVDNQTFFESQEKAIDVLKHNIIG